MHNDLVAEEDKYKMVAPLLTWEAVHKKLPWGVIFLMGGGYSLATACEVN